MPSKLGIKAILRSRATAEASTARPSARTRSHAGTFVLAMIAMLAPFLVQRQSAQGQMVEAQPESAGTATVQGFVRDSGKRPVAAATVFLQAKDAQTLTVRTDAAGAYRFSAVRQGLYTLRAEVVGYTRAISSPFVLGEKESRTIDLTLDSARTSDPQKFSAGSPEFFDEPHFTVAGVTDATSLGGHGSDTIVRNREALAQATVSLSKQTPGNSAPDSSAAATEKSLREAAEDPRNFDANYRLGKLLVDEGKAPDALPYLERAFRLNPRGYDNAYELALAYADAGDYERARTEVRVLLSAQDKSREGKSEPHHLLADADERLGNPLEAGREYQRAAELNPSESNLFDWGSELLLHHAAEPALEVFTKGNRLFPRSVRMLVGVGASWYALGSYDQAAQRFCAASDLNPDDPTPYLFMGKMQVVETTPSETIAERLGRFVGLQPQNALANYYYAVSLWKRRKSPEDVTDLAQVKTLLEKAAHLDPSFGLAYLQLGILYSEQKDYSCAISAYQQAIKATPQLEEAHYRLAQVYKQTGETSKAQAELQLYMQLSKEKAEETERQRHEVQQFVYQLRDRTPASQPQ